MSKFERARHMTRLSRLCQDRAFNRRATWLKDYPTEPLVFKFPTDARWLLGKIKDAGEGGIAQGLLVLLFKDHRPELLSPEKSVQRHIRFLKNLSLIDLKDYKGRVLK